eukprot:12149994-Alexandrium_andersonii.AAC.1
MAAAGGLGTMPDDGLDCAGALCERALHSERVRTCRMRKFQGTQSCFGERVPPEAIHSPVCRRLCWTRQRLLEHYEMNL